MDGKLKTPASKAGAALGTFAAAVLVQFLWIGIVAGFVVWLAPGATDGAFAPTFWQAVSGVILLNILGTFVKGAK